MSPDLAFNTAVSFVTNTNWQGYGGETTMSYLTQMAGLTVQNFVSAAAGIALAIALIRGFARRSAQTVGNFWVDLTRCTLYVLLPMSIVVALVLVCAGRAAEPRTPMPTRRRSKAPSRRSPRGRSPRRWPSSMLGTNGGGFFNANSAHPFENPNALTNLSRCWRSSSISAALTYTFGRMVGDQRQGWAIFAVDGRSVPRRRRRRLLGRSARQPGLRRARRRPGAAQAGGNMEGKEVRFGIANSAIWATRPPTPPTARSTPCTTATRRSAAWCRMVNIQLGEIIFGGVGSGLYGMLLFAILAVFVAGLMVGRTPEYLGKKIEAKEVKMAMLAILILPLSILGFTALAVGAAGRARRARQCRPHGFSEILYAFTSGTGNNGSAFAGLSANTPFYNTDHRPRDADRPLPR